MSLSKSTSEFAGKPVSFFWTSRQSRYVRPTGEPLGSKDGSRVASTSVDMEIPVSRPAERAHAIGGHQMRVESFVGTVMRIDAGAVAADLLTAGGRVRVSLPTALFPESPRYGQSFTLSIRSDGGIKKPSIVMGGGLPSMETLRLRREADQLMAQF